MLMRPAGRSSASRAPGAAARQAHAAGALGRRVHLARVVLRWRSIYLSRLSRLLAGAHAAATAPLLLAAYPFAVFFNAPYTEALFLLGAVGAFYHFHRERWVAASLFGLLVGLQPSERLLRVGAAGVLGVAGA